jgi:hypothetical protein
MSSRSRRAPCHASVPKHCGTEVPVIRAHGINVIALRLGREVVRVNIFWFDCLLPRTSKLVLPHDGLRKGRPEGPRRHKLADHQRGVDRLR